MLACCVSQRVPRLDLLAIRHVSSHNQRNLLLSKLLDGNLKRVRLALQVHQHRRIHAVPASVKTLPCRSPPPGSSVPDLQRARAQDARPLVLGHVRRGRALAFGNLLVLEALLAALEGVGRRGRVARDDDVVLLVDLGRALGILVLDDLGVVVLVHVLILEHRLVAVGSLALAVLTRALRPEIGSNVPADTDIIVAKVRHVAKLKKERKEMS